MGFSASAYLGFGIDLGEEFPWRDPETYEETHEDLGAYLASLTMDDPWKSVPAEIRDGYDDSAYAAWKKSNPWFEFALKVWYEEQRRAENKSLIKLVHYGYYENSCYALIIKNTLIEAFDCGSQKIDHIGTPPLHEIRAIEQYCTEKGLPRFINPTWLLMASYG